MSGLVSGLMSGLMSGLVTGLMTGLMSGLMSGLILRTVSNFEGSMLRSLELCQIRKRHHCRLQPAQLLETSDPRAGCSRRDFFVPNLENIEIF